MEIVFEITPEKAKKILEFFAKNPKVRKCKVLLGNVFFDFQRYNIETFEEIIKSNTTAKSILEVLGWGGHSLLSYLENPEFFDDETDGRSRTVRNSVDRRINKNKKSCHLDLNLI